MKVSPVSLVSAGLLAMAAAAVFAVIARLPGSPLGWLPMLLVDSTPVAKLCMFSLVLPVLIAAVRVAIGLLMRPRRSRVLAGCVILALGLALWGGGDIWYGTWLASVHTGVHRLDVLAPNLSEGFIALAIGLLVAAAIQAANHWLGDRA